MHLHKRKLITIFIGVMLTCTGYSQQLPNYSQYLTNFFLINPAAAGAEGYTAFNFTAREENIGITDAAKTHSISAQSRILKNSFIKRGHSVRRRGSSGGKGGNNGYGAYLYDDRNGALHRLGLQLTYSHHLRVKSIQFSGGVSLLGYQNSLNDVRLNEGSNNDPTINERRNKYGIDANMGVFAMHSKFKGGISITNLIGTEGNERHYIAHGNYIYRPSRAWKYEPTLLLKWPESQIPQGDIFVKATYRGTYWGGLGYRTGSSMIIFYGLKFDKYYFNYSFEYNLNEIRKYSMGTHEFSLAVKLGENARRYRWLNRY
ncbi:PorP/SprF family type IX secretion system membrane protein [Bacteroidales bacterium]|nr:PorP/SprF family type IX secretion system membrane protein [Bacteroidales bacterium]